MLVTDLNKLRYIHAVARFKTVTAISKQARAFSLGVSEIIPLSYLTIFSPPELQQLLSGESKRGFDVQDLKRNTNYTGGYTFESATIQMFWKFLETEFSDEDKVAFLTFVTSSPRAPLLGFSNLNPLFTIHVVPEAENLPTASTCVNLLKLPVYTDYEVLKKKIMQAIHSHAGFSLS